MSLDISKLGNVRERGEKVTAQCPACAETGHDQTRNHLIIQADGRFGCVIYPGASPDASAHRKRIFALCGDREIRPVAVHPSGLGRLGRVFQTHLAVRPVKTGLLGRLGRVFETHLEREREPTVDKEHNADRRLNDCGKGVPSVPVEPHRPLSEREWAILVRAGEENDPIIIEALRLFDARIVE